MDTQGIPRVIHPKEFCLLWYKMLTALLAMVQEFSLLTTSNLKQKDKTKV